MTIATPDTTEYQLSPWDLSELMPEPRAEAIAGRFAALEEAVCAFEARRQELDPAMDPSAFLGVLEDYEALIRQMVVLDAHASLWFSSDTQCQAALTHQGRVHQALTDATNRTLFISLWWKGLSDAEAERLTPRGEEAADFRHYLADLRRLRPYTLSEEAEQIINLKDTDGMEGLLTLYSVLTNRLEFTLEIDGETRVMTRDGLMSHVHSPRAEVREAAYRELYRVYAREATPLAQIYANRVRDWHSEMIRLRGYSSPIAARNVGNDIPDAAVEVLLAETRKHAHLFQRYFRLKAGWLGLPRLRRYDVYAPLADSDREVPFAEGARLVLSTFRDFHPRVARLAERVLDDSHLDSELRKGKRGGAFCATVLPHQTPWVLVNYAGRLRDVSTLAHELGHAVHSMLAAEHSILTVHASLPLAETASVFAEMLITERLLELEDDPPARAELLVTSMDNIYATVMRQAYFILFEMEAHRAILAGQSPEELNGLFMANLAEQFGESVEVAEEFQHEWVSIPHIYHTPFYCYAYSFGQLLVLALYRRYQQEGEAFIPGYLRMLAHGGSARPQEILSEAGVDVTDPGFWRGGFEVIGEMLDTLEETLESARR